MCGRFNLAGLSWAEIHALLSVGRAPAGWDEGRDVQAMPQRYNVAPTQGAGRKVWTDPVRDRAETFPVINRMKKG